MQLTPTIELAIKKASILHDGQTRRGEKSFPYLTHLFSVATILSEYTRDEKTIIAGLLHDTIEDTKYTFEELENEFGKEVKDIVYYVTEVKMCGGQKIPWKERKDAYLALLEEASRSALFVSAADKIHNLQSTIDDYKKHGPMIWKNFSTSVENNMWFYKSVLEVLKRRLNNGIVDEYERVLKEADELFAQ
jgi:(p)ppGpp synthase/HD superfamily hydrolase